MDSEWRDLGMNIIDGDRAARDTHTTSFLDSLKHEIEAYTRLLCKLIIPESSGSMSNEPSIEHQYFNETTAHDLEHDQLLYRAQTNKKSPRIQPRPWLCSDQISKRDAIYEDYLQTQPDSTKVRGDLDVVTLKCLEPLSWLNDEVMNAYVDLINEACQKLSLPVHCWNTFFWPNLTGADGRDYDYDKVRRWTKRRNIDIFSLDLMFIPLHINHVHWSLGLVDLKSRLIFFFDSLGYQAPDQYLKTVRRYLEDEWSDKRRQTCDQGFNPLDYLYAGNNFALSMYSASGCHYRECLLDPNGDVRQANLPRQQNGSDCGVFTCLFMRELSLNRFPFHFSEDVNQVRKMMLREIVEGSIDLPA